MATINARVQKEISSLRRAIDKEVQAGRLSPYLLLFVYEQLLQGKTSLSAAATTFSPAQHSFNVELLQTPTNRLHLSGRARNRLRRADAINLGRIIQMSKVDLLDMKNLGVITLNEIEAVVQSHGLELGTPLPPEIKAVVGEPRK